MREQIIPFEKHTHKQTMAWAPGAAMQPMPPAAYAQPMANPMGAAMPAGCYNVGTGIFCPYANPSPSPLRPGPLMVVPHTMQQQTVGSCYTQPQLGFSTMCGNLKTKRECDVHSALCYWA